MSSRLFVSRRLPGFQHRLLSRRFRPTKAKKRTQQRVVVVVVVFGFFAFLSFSSSQVVSSRAAQGEWMSSRQNISWKQRPFQIHYLGSQNIFFLWLKVGFLVKCMASRLQTNNELSSLFQRKKKVFRISARRTTTRPRETCGFDVVVVVSRVRSVVAVRATKRGDPRESHGARFSFSHFFFLLFFSA